jgi:6-phosphogluconate dehydrogenase
MRLNTLYVDDNKDEEEDNIAKEKKDKMYIYLQEDGINVDDGLDNCSNDVLEYEKILKEFYNYSHKNVRSIIGLWNEKKFEEYYIEITKITTNALNIGANNLYAMLCEQQKNYNVGDMKMVANNVKSIFDEWKKVLLYIAEYFKN